MAAFCLPFRTIFSLFGRTRDVVAETFDLINPSHCELDFPSGICFIVLLLLLFAIAAQVHRALPLESVGFLSSRPANLSVLCGFPSHVSCLSPQVSA